jgi:hypothetical protein
MKVIKSSSATKSHGLFAPMLLAIILAALFYKSFLPDYVHFSNDGPLGQQNSRWLQPAAGLTGMWDDLNSLGFAAGAYAPSLTMLIVWILGPVGCAKFLVPIALFILGLGAWTFFRQLRLSPLAAMLGALAASLNTTFFAGACWGVASLEIAVGMDFFALALLVSNMPETPRLLRWTRLALAGMAVGINVMEGADVGTLFSMIIAAFVFFKAIADEGGPILIKLGRGVFRVAIVAVFAGFIATQTVVALVGSGIVGAGQETETKAAQWDWATQWSLPKKETLAIIVPGLFGYRLDTPKDMMPQLQKAYRNGIYWGGMGRDPAADRFLDSGAPGTPPGMLRFGYNGSYCGILVVLIALWAIVQSLRRQSSPFSGVQKKFIWFWSVLLVVSLLLAWGRFAPMFYGILYHLPYFSTIRNPVKFAIFFVWALLVLFAYGVHVLSVRHLDGSAKKSAGLNTQLKIWWSKAGNFDRKWTFALAGIFSASVFGWLIYAAQKPSFVKYLQKVGFPDEDVAGQIAAFSLGQVGWFIVLLAIAIILVTLVIAGYFAGPRAKLGSVLLGAFLVFDLGRANLPYIIHWDYKQKYESNPVIDFLKDKPYEHRVIGLPHLPEQFQLLEELYGIEWAQQLFPYYNIQSLDIVQMPRMPADLEAFENALNPRGASDAAYLVARRWQLTNTRYLLAPAVFLDSLNEQIDPVQRRFRIVQRFDIVPKPGIDQPTQLEELTAVNRDNGPYALFEFTGALPRVKLYSNWQVSTNDAVTLQTLASPNFDPLQTVLVSAPLPMAPGATNQNSGMVDFKSYAPNDIVFNAQTDAPSVLLLNDKFDPHWRAFVDGKPAELLRCNFIMRGVYLTPGAHTVEFQFKLQNGPLYISLAAIMVGFCLFGYLCLAGRKNSLSNSHPD